jgi:hypothetical protein
MKHLTDVLRIKLSVSLNMLKLIYPAALLHYFASNLHHKVQNHSWEGPWCNHGMQNLLSVKQKYFPFWEKLAFE